MRRTRKGRLLSRREELRTLFTVTAATLLPVLATVWIVFSTTQQDLSDVVPIHQLEGKYLLLSWPALLHHPNVRPWTLFADKPVQACGYMVEGADPIQKNEWVEDFVLLPGSGTLFHPAHRFGDQMISVRLEEGERVQYSPKSLVWVWGTFRASNGDPNGSTPLYALDHARAKAADQADLRKYFR